jgi:hypothetical protein
MTPETLEDLCSELLSVNDRLMESHLQVCAINEQLHAQNAALSEQVRVLTEQLAPFVK